MEPSVSAHVHRSSAFILYLISASVFVANIGMGVVWPIVPVYAKELGATGLQVGLIIASFSVARTLLGPWVGRLSDKSGRRPFILWGLLLYTAVSLLYTFAGGVNDLILVRLLHGISSVMVVPVALALVGDTSPRDRLGVFLGTINMAILLGAGAGPILGGLIKETLGMKSAFYTMGAMSLATFLMCIFLPSGKAAASSPAAKEPALPLSASLRHRAVMGLFLLRLLFAFGQGCVYAFLPLFGLQLNLTSAQVGLILGANIIFIASLQRSFGGVADKYNSLYQLMAGMVISSLSVAAMGLAGGFWSLLWLNLLMGLGNGVSMPAGFVITARAGRKLGMGAVMGFLEMAWSLGMIISPVAAGIFMDKFGLERLFFAGGLLVLLGSGLSFMIMRPSEEAGPQLGLQKNP
jgi:MFS family permease